MEEEGEEESTGVRRGKMKVVDGWVDETCRYQTGNQYQRNSVTV